MIGVHLDKRYHRRLLAGHWANDTELNTHAHAFTSPWFVAH